MRVQNLTKFFTVALIILTMSVASLLFAKAEPQPNQKVFAGTTTIDSLLTVILRFLPDSIPLVRAGVFPLIVNDLQDGNAYGTWMSEYIALKLGNNPRFTLANQSFYRSTLRKLDISLKDVLDDSATFYISKTMGIDYAISGTLTGSANDSNIAIDVRIVNIHTGIILTSATAGSTLLACEELVHSMQTRKSQTEIGPTMVRSAVPGLAQMYRKRYLAGAITLGSFLGASAFTISQISPYLKANKEYTDYRDNSGVDIDDELYKQTGDSLHAIAEKKLTFVSIGAALIGLAYLSNIGDALISSVISRNNFSLYFSMASPLSPALAIRYSF